MTDVVRRIFAVLVCLTVAGGGTFCRCAAAAAAAASSAGTARTDCRPAAPAPGASHACCHTTPASPNAPAGQDGKPADPPPTQNQPTSHCEQCNAQIAPAPDAKSTAPSPLLCPAGFATLPDHFGARLLAPTKPSVSPDTSESPPPRDRLTLYALRCSLLD